MADAAPRGRGGFGSRGDRGGDRRGRGRGRGRRGGKQEEKEWQPVTKLGRLVKAGKITSMEQIYLHSLPIKEYQIVDFFLPKLKDEVMKVRPRIGGLRHANRNCVRLKCMRNAIARRETITITG
jgi:small subunit ribosomal protein S2e